MSISTANVTVQRVKAKNPSTYLTREMIANQQAVAVIAGQVSSALFPASTERVAANGAMLSLAFAINKRDGNVTVEFLVANCAGLSISGIKALADNTNKYLAEQNKARHLASLKNQARVGTV